MTATARAARAGAPGLLRSWRLLALAHRWPTAGAVLLGAVLLHGVGGSNRLSVPFTADAVTVAVVAGLLAGQAAAIAVWPVTPWPAWRSHRRVVPLVAGLAAAVLAAVAAGGVLASVLSARPVVTAWAASAGLAWLGLALTRDLATSWTVPLSLTMASLVTSPSGEPGLLHGVHVATWYEAPPLQVLVLPLLLVPVAAAACALVLPRAGGRRGRLSPG